MSISSFSLFLLILALPFYRTSAAAAEVAAGSDLFNPIQLPSNYGLTSALVSSTSAESGNLCPDTVVDPGSCPVKCFRADPVCGADGVTYWCGCAEAICGGARVAKMGFCEVGNGGSGPVSGQALLLVHILWLILLGFFVLFGLL